MAYRTHPEEVQATDVPMEVERVHSQTKLGNLECWEYVV